MAIDMWCGLFRCGPRDLRLCYFVGFRLILACVCRYCYVPCLLLVVLAFSSIFANLDLVYFCQTNKITNIKKRANYRRSITTIFMTCLTYKTPHPGYF